MAINEESGHPCRPRSLTRDLADEVRAYGLAQLPAYGREPKFWRIAKTEIAQTVRCQTVRCSKIKMGAPRSGSPAPA